MNYVCIVDDDHLGCADGHVSAAVLVSHGAGP